MTEERDGETLTVIHLTFCEFLAAKEAVEGPADGFHKLLRVQRRLSVPDAAPRAATRLIEVIPFAVGLLPRVRRSEVLDEVLEVRCL